MLSVANSAAGHLSIQVENQTPRQDSGAASTSIAQTPEAPNATKEAAFAHRFRKKIPIAAISDTKQSTKKNQSSHLWLVRISGLPDTHRATAPKASVSPNETYPSNP